MPYLDNPKSSPAYHSLGHEGYHFLSALSCVHSWEHLPAVGLYSRLRGTSLKVPEASVLL